LSVKLGKLPAKPSKIHPNPKPSGVHLLIDLDFNSLMQQKEIKSLCKQLEFCYSVNRRSSHPVSLSGVGLTEEIKNALEAWTPNYIRWDQFPFREQKLEELYTTEKESLVYLTADSPNRIQSFDPSKKYIIGGLVDHNRHKKFCFNRAKELGIQHAQLPISEHISLVSRRILAVNHCVEIILNYLANDGDWKMAFHQVIPERKQSPSNKTTILPNIEDESAAELEDDSDNAPSTTQEVVSLP
jgi:tRNA (guanine9-N1)-methyltransferase